MKTLKLSIVLLLLSGVFSCKKDNSGSASLTSDQAADMAASALSSNSGGVASMSDDISANAATFSSTGPSVNSVGVATVHQECGTTSTDSATFSGTTSSVTYSYFAKYSHTLNCNSEQQPDNIVNALTYNGTFSGPRISTTANGTANATIAGLTTAASNFVINGEYKRAGTFESKVGNKATGNSNIDIVVTSLTLSKPGRQIVSGTATFSVSGVAGKVTYNYTGNIVFNGDGTATLNVTGGSSYTVNLGSGGWTKH